MQSVPEQFPVQSVPEQFPVQSLPEQFPVQSVPEQFPVQSVPEQFLSSISIAPKKSDEFLPVINLRKLLCETQPPQEGGVILLSKHLEDNDYLCKSDMKDAYFPVRLRKESRKHAKFQWREKVTNLYVCV